MGQKKIKRSKTGPPAVDPQLDEVDEERAFEIQIDEEEKEIVLTHHYRRKWGDEFDADIDHCLNIEEASEFVAALLGAIDVLNKIAIVERDTVLVEKSTPRPIEGNPMQGPKNIDEK